MDIQPKDVVTFIDDHGCVRFGVVTETRHITDLLGSHEHFMVTHFPHPLDTSAPAVCAITAEDRIHKKARWESCSAAETFIQESTAYRAAVAFAKTLEEPEPEAFAAHAQEAPAAPPPAPL